MKERDIKVLQFREELIKLLNKYNYEILNSCYDNGDIDIIDLINGEQYIFENSTSNYNVYKGKKDNLFLLEDILAENILQLFPDELKNNDYILCNNKIGIITNDVDKCNTIFKKIYSENEKNIEYFKNSTYSKELKLLSGEVYVWIKARKSSRGHKCSKAYIDKNIPLDILHNIVLPICVLVSRKDVKII